MRGMDATPAASRRPRRFTVPWDWTDVLLFLVIFLASIILLGVIVSLPAVQQTAQKVVSGLPAQAQQGLATFVIEGLFYAIGVATILILVVGRRSGRVRDLGWRGCRFWWIPVALVVAAASLRGLTFVAGWFAGFFPGQENPQVPTVQLNYGHYYGLAIPPVVLFAPTGEETFFRGFLYGWLRRRLPIAPAAALSGMAFMLLHPWQIWPAIFLLGVILALLYEYSRSLLPGIIVHASFNLVELLQILG